MKAKSKAIAEAIIRIVANGPATFVELLAQIPEMAARPGEDSWTWEIDGIVVWSGLSGPGIEGLSAAVKSHKVALMPCSKILYILQGKVIDDPNWFAVCLAPKAMANYGSADRLVVVLPALVPGYEELMAQQAEPRIFRL